MIYTTAMVYALQCSVKPLQSRSAVSEDWIDEVNSDRMERVSEAYRVGEGQELYFQGIRFPGPGPEG